MRLDINDAWEFLQKMRKHERRLRNLFILWSLLVVYQFGWLVYNSYRDRIGGAIVALALGAWMVYCRDEVKENRKQVKEFIIDLEKNINQYYLLVFEHHLRTWAKRKKLL